MDDKTCDDCESRSRCEKPELVIAFVDSFYPGDPLLALAFFRDIFERTPGFLGSGDGTEVMLYNYIVQYYKKKILEEVSFN